MYYYVATHKPFETVYTMENYCELYAVKAILDQKKQGVRQGQNNTERKRASVTQMLCTHYIATRIMLRSSATIVYNLYMAIVDMSC